MKISHITKREIPKGEDVKVQDIREGIYKLIQSEFPDLDQEGYISITELYYYSRHYLTSLILKEKGELDIIDRDDAFPQSV